VLTARCVTKIALYIKHILNSDLSGVCRSVEAHRLLQNSLRIMKTVPRQTCFVSDVVITNFFLNETFLRRTGKEEYYYLKYSLLYVQILLCCCCFTALMWFPYYSTNIFRVGYWLRVCGWQKFCFCAGLSLFAARCSNILHCDPQILTKLVMQQNFANHKHNWNQFPLHLI
jgi:hypothetical protein